MTYEATLRAKQRHVADCFERIGHMQVNVPPVLGMEHPFAYRNKTALPVGGTAEHPQLGFFAPRSHALIRLSPTAPTTPCPPPNCTLRGRFSAGCRRTASPPTQKRPIQAFAVT